MDSTDSDVVVSNRMRSVLSNRDAVRLMNATMAGDLTRRFPSLSGLDDRDLMIMMGVALGFSYRRIAKALKLSIGTVHNVSKRIDPEGMYRMDRDAMAEYISSRARAMAGEVLSSVDLTALDGEPQKQVDVAKKLSEIAVLNEKAKGVEGCERVSRLVVEFVGAGDKQSGVSCREVEEAEYRICPPAGDEGTAIDGVC